MTNSTTPPWRPCLAPGPTRNDQLDVPSTAQAALTLAIAGGTTGFWAACALDALLRLVG